MADLEDEELIAGYLKFLELRETRHDDYFWAWERLQDLINDDPKRAWHVIRALIDQADPSHLPLLGAGPLEELLGVLADQLDKGDESLVLALDGFVRASDRCR